MADTASLSGTRAEIHRLAARRTSKSTGRLLAREVPAKVSGAPALDLGRLLSFREARCLEVLAPPLHCSSVHQEERSAFGKTVLDGFGGAQVVERPLESKIIVVIDATGGIGAETVRRLADDGATVVASARSMDVLNQLDATGPNVVTHQSDVSNEVEARGLVERAETDFGRLDAVFNGAGIVGKCGLIEDQDLDSFNHVMDVNVGGVSLMMKHAVPALRRNDGGAIIDFSPLAGLTGGRATMPRSG